MTQSALNYTGGKYKLLPQILPHFPQNIGTFVDLFCGGCNVGLNVNADRYIYNDICEPLINMYSVMKNTDTEAFIEFVSNIIRDYDLSDVKQKGYGFYGCDSGRGLSDYNKDKYRQLRSDFNSSKLHDDGYYIKLYVLIVYSFNNQIRFNNKGEFNLPPGKRDFNQNMERKLRSFLKKIHSQNCSFLSTDFNSLDISHLTKSDFVYADPPYLITCASYNEQDGWNEEKEEHLLLFLDSLTKKGVRFALSNVMEAKGKTNEILKNWTESRSSYKIYELNYDYNNANYQRKGKDKKSKEVLITNF